MYYLFTDDNNSDWLVNLLKAYQGTGYYLLLFGLQETHVACSKRWTG